MTKSLTELFEFKNSKMRRFIKRGMEGVFDETQQIVPLDSGDLRDSGKMESLIDDKSYIYEISYSSKNKRDGYDYAEIQHDNLEYNHAVGRSAKYIEIPFNKFKRKLKRRYK